MVECILRISTNLKSVLLINAERFAEGEVQVCIARPVQRVPVDVAEHCYTRTSIRKLIEPIGKRVN